MATWHQKRNPVKLYHETEWTVVVDPPNRAMCLMLFKTEQEAIEYKNKVEHAYILKPANMVK